MSPSIPSPSSPASSVSSPRRAVLGGLTRACTTAAALAQASCSGPSQELRRFHTAPPAAECPPGAVESMEQLGMFNVRVEPTVAFPQPQGIYAKVRPGPVTIVSHASWGALPSQTTQFSGELFFVNDRVQGRFTEARTAEGKTHPICAELWLGYMHKGLAQEEGSTRDTAVVRAWPTLRAVKHFD